MTLEKAIKMLKEEYEKAKKQEFVQKPLAYALYYTWRNVDEKLNNTGLNKFLIKKGKNDD
jgi:hypothetical protein